MDPTMEAISLNGRETELLMRLIVLGTALHAFGLAEKDTALSIMDKLRRGIEQQSARQMRDVRDERN
jgi:hypothetical protein